MRPLDAKPDRFIEVSPRGWLPRFLQDQPRTGLLATRASHLAQVELKDAWIQRQFAAAYQGMRSLQDFDARHFGECLGYKIQVIAVFVLLVLRRHPFVGRDINGRYDFADRSLHFDIDSLPSAS